MKNYFRTDSGKAGGVPSSMLRNAREECENEWQPSREGITSVWNSLKELSRRRTWS
jgi:hypothetical protein